MKMKQQWARFAALGLVFGLAVGAARAGDEIPYQAQFDVSNCRLVPWGVNRTFMPLIPGYGLYLAGEDEEEGEFVEVLITVEWALRTVGGIRCAVIREKEWIDEELVEISFNYFTMCRDTKTVYYLGEEVDIFEDDEVVSHDGEWLASDDANTLGVIMPGDPMLGTRYYQEWAPEIALDRAEHIGVNESVTTPAGTFHGCLVVAETTPLEPDDVSYKAYAPGVGLVVDDVIRLIDSGYRIKQKYDR